VEHSGGGDGRCKAGGAAEGETARVPTIGCHAGCLSAARKCRFQHRPIQAAIPRSRAGGGTTPVGDDPPFFQDLDASPINGRRSKPRWRRARSLPWGPSGCVDTGVSGCALGRGGYPQQDLRLFVRRRAACGVAACGG